MQTLTEGPAEALKRVGLTQKDARAVATGKAEPPPRASLARWPSGCGANGGAPQWTRGKYLAATLMAWLDEKKVSLRSMRAGFLTPLQSWERGRGPEFGRGSSGVAQAGSLSVRARHSFRRPRFRWFQKSTPEGAGGRQWPGRAI
jgi:hypothetical protein